MNPKGDWSKANKIIKESKTPKQREQEKKHEKEIQEILKEIHLLNEDPQNLAENSSTQENIKQIQQRAKDDPENDTIQALHIQTIKGLIESDKKMSTLLKKPQNFKKPF